MIYLYNLHNMKRISSLINILLDLPVKNAIPRPSYDLCANCKVVIEFR